MTAKTLNLTLKIWRQDGPSSPGELKRRLTEIAYLTTLFGDVDEALGEGPRGTRHRH